MITIADTLFYPQCTVSEGKYAYWAWPALVTHSFFALTVCMQGHYYYLVVQHSQAHSIYKWSGNLSFSVFWPFLVVLVILDKIPHFTAAPLFTYFRRWPRRVRKWSFLGSKKGRKPKSQIDFFWGVKELIDTFHFLGVPGFLPLFSVFGGRQKHGRGNDKFLQFWSF